MILYSYNGIIAKKLPTWDQVAHPHAIVAPNAVNEETYALFISDKPFVYNTATGTISRSEEDAEVLRAAYFNDAWGEFVETDATELLAAQWTNSNIPDENGQMWLMATEPVLYDAPLIITHDVTVDMMRPGMAPIIHAAQDDQYSRDIRFTILCGGRPWLVPAGAKVIVRYLQPNKNGSNYDIMEDGKRAATIDGNTVTVKLAPQVLAVEGVVMLALSIECGGTKVNTFYVKIDVQLNPGVQAMSGNYFKIAGALADSGWTPNKYLGSDENGNVVEKEAPAGTGSADVVSSISITEDADGTITMVNTTETGNTETIVLTPDANGNPNKLTYNGMEIPLSWVVSG